MINKTVLTVVLLAIGFNSFAAQEIRNSDMATMKEKIGSVSVNIKNGTFEEAMNALEKKSDEKGAGYYHITSIDRPGMSSDIRATATIYK